MRINVVATATAVVLMLTACAPTESYQHRPLPSRTPVYEEVTEGTVSGFEFSPTAEDRPYTVSVETDGGIVRIKLDKSLSDTLELRDQVRFEDGVLTEVNGEDVDDRS